MLAAQHLETLPREFCTVDPPQTRVPVSSNCPLIWTALNTFGVECAMRGREAKKRGSKATSAAQLDLFSRPPANAGARQGVQPVTRRAGLAAPIIAEPSPRSPVDPLVAFVLGTGRSRGRPEKMLSAGIVEPADQRRLLDVREAALRLGLSKSTLDKMRCSGRGPKFIRATARAIRYDPADLQAFADERRRRSTSDLDTLLAD